MRLLRPLLVVASAVALVASACAPSGGKTIKAVFDDIGDLVPLADVQQSDADVGRITNIELTEDWNALVTMQLEHGTPVPEGTRAVVRSTSLLGEKFVDLIPPEGAEESSPQMPDGATIPIERTRTAPVIEEVLAEVGGIIVSGALSDLGTLTTIFARIVEEQEDDIGAVIDSTQRLVASLSSQREALATSLERLASSAETLNAGEDVVNRFLTTSAEAVTILADEREELGELIRQLDRLGQPQAELFRRYKDETNRQIEALIAVVDKVHEARQDLDTSLTNLPSFAELFARATPGDYIQLDVLIEGFPTVPAGGSVGSIFWGAVE